jgi:hypothetical protein
MQPKIQTSLRRVAGVIEWDVDIAVYRQFSR